MANSVNSLCILTRNKGEIQGSLSRDVINTRMLALYAGTTKLTEPHSKLCEDQ